MFHCAGIVLVLRVLLVVGEQVVSTHFKTSGYKILNKLEKQQKTPRTMFKFSTISNRSLVVYPPLF